jgi:signal transduction histidine kinase/ActR/RegA family two-component response regulator
MELSALERMTRLLEVASALSKTITPRQVADVVMHMGLSALGARSGALLTIDDESGEYVLLERACDPGEPPHAVRLPSDAQTPVVVCARTGRPVTDGAYELCLPLLIRGHAIGALALQLRPGEVFDDERCALVEAAADQCAQALERARLYAIEQLRREELEVSNRLKDDFLGIVSHELRTPLSAILGWARMLKRGVVGPHSQERALDAIERNATLQARLVDDLLDVSRIVSGKLELETGPVDLSSVVDAAVDSVRPSLIAKGVDVRLSLPPLCDDVVTVLGDAARLQQVVWNLLTNAIKFTKPGGRIDLRLECEGRVGRISVKDDGIGIPPDVLPHVFERFKQADDSATRQHGGLGLGLSIVRHVVEAHGGTVRALSEGVGRGTEMLVELPTSEAPKAPTDADHPAAADPPSPTLDGARVLLIDDDEDTRDYLAAALQASGADLVAVGSATAAAETMGVWRPDVIISDIAMPGLDGYAFIRGVRALPEEAGGRTPAVALTALARSRDRVRAFAAGFQTHLTKPIDPRELVLAVASLLPGGRRGGG